MRLAQKSNKAVVELVAAEMKEKETKEKEVKQTAEADAASAATRFACVSSPIRLCPALTGWRNVEGSQSGARA